MTYFQFLDEKTLLSCYRYVVGLCVPSAYLQISGSFVTESLPMIWAQLGEGRTCLITFAHVYVKFNAVNSFQLSQFFGELLTFESFGKKTRKERTQAKAL